VKSFISWILILAIIGGGGWFALQSYGDLNRKHSYFTDLSDLHNDFRAQSAGLVHLDEKEYVKEIGIHLTRYFSALARLGRQYPEDFNPERARAEGQLKIADGHMSQSQYEARDERITLTLELMEKMKQGQYRPVHSIVDKGFRFDILGVEPVTAQGQGMLRLSYAHWGAWGPVDYDMIVGTIHAAQKKGKAIEVPQIVGEGQPPALQVDPGRWVKEFFPGVEVGYYTLPLMPEVAETLQLSFNFSVRTVGGTAIPIAIAFPALEVQRSWKVGEGQKWQASERYASDEELKELGAKPSIAVSK